MAEVEQSIVKVNIYKAYYSDFRIFVYTDLGLTYTVCLIDKWSFYPNSETNLKETKEELIKCKKFGKLVCSRGKDVFNKYFGDLNNE